MNVGMYMHACVYVYVQLVAVETEDSVVTLGCNEKMGIWRSGIGWFFKYFLRVHIPMSPQTVLLWKWEEMIGY